jgi:hypothetical protein
VSKVLGAEYEVEGGEPLEEASPLLLGHTSADPEDQPGVGGLEPPEGPELAVELLLRLVPHRAGVQNDEVCLPHLGGRSEALMVEKIPDLLGVVLVHLAPEGA